MPSGRYASLTRWTTLQSDLIGSMSRQSFRQSFQWCRRLWHPVLPNQAKERRQ